MMNLWDLRGIDRVRAIKSLERTTSVTLIELEVYRIDMTEQIRKIGNFTRQFNALGVAALASLAVGAPAAKSQTYRESALQRAASRLQNRIDNGKKVSVDLSHDVLFDQFPKLQPYSQARRSDRLSPNREVARPLIAEVNGKKRYFEVIASKCGLKVYPVPEFNQEVVVDGLAQGPVNEHHLHGEFEPVRTKTARIGELTIGYHHKAIVENVELSNRHVIHNVTVGVNQPIRLVG